MVLHHRQPVHFLSHGGGPWPYMDGPYRERYAELERSLRTLFGVREPPPSAVLIVSGHWEAADFTVASHPRPSMIYDFTGFPDYTYDVKYSAPGSPELAERVQALVEAGGLRCRMDPERGFDHGTYCVMQPARPEADLPVVQMSIKVGYDPAEHAAMVRSLAPLRDEGVAIIGSGLSYHNLSALGSEGGLPSRVFDAWLHETVVEHSGSHRLSRLERWSEAPMARSAHPREDHLLPLMVAAGAAEGEDAMEIYHEDAFFGSLTVSSYRFG